jgi:4-amino-4-deoxy-L-arabinose transferase-like glycosyltransferase
MRMDRPRRVWIRRGGSIVAAERRPLRLVRPPHGNNGSGSSVHPPAETDSMNGGPDGVDARERLARRVAWPQGREPLWLRMTGPTADGTAVPSVPGIGRLRSAPVDSVLRGLGARVRSAVALRTDIAVQVVLLTAVALVVATNASHWPATQFDEGTYVSYAWAVGHGKLANYTYSYGHPPLAWILIFLWTWVSGIFGHMSFSIAGAREFMVVVSVVSCSLLYTLARRLGFARGFAAAAVLLFALSPLSIWFHRAVLLDNPSIAWALAAFVLARTPGRRLWAFAASGACFAAAVLCKETTLDLLPALLYAAYQNADRRTARYCLTLLISCFFLIALSYMLYAALKGELVPGKGHVSLLGYAVIQLFSRQGTGSPFNPASQAHAIISGWLRLDPWLLGSACALVPVALVRRSTRSVAVAFLIQATMVLRPGYLPNMYVIGLLPFAALIVTGGLEALWRRSQEVTRRPLAWSLAVLLLIPAGALALTVARHWQYFDQVAMSGRPDAATGAAEKWVVAHIGRDERLIVNDEFWVYLIEHGFDAHPMRGGFYSRTVVSYWPLDYDPAVKRAFPGGWRAFDYVISTQAIRSTTQTPTTAHAIAHSRLVITFGRGITRIEVRAIIRPARRPAER